VEKLLSTITCELDQEVGGLFVIQDIGVTTKYWRSPHAEYGFQLDGSTFRLRTTAVRSSFCSVPWQKFMRVECNR
jgi:hypothetical protein